MVIGLTTPIILTAPVNAEPHCHCRTAKSELVEVGDYTCIKTNEGLREARCEFVLNNTAWKFTGKLCPVGLNEHNQKERIQNVARIDFKKLS
ncbi:MAG: hypothetical protein ABJM86_05665 [Hyphomicrobiales bacterium]